jgi:cob(I)alamin adenosyltransferase
VEETGMGNRLSRIYTRTGDDGTTGLGDGHRVRKDDARVEAYGTVDEANSAIGTILAVPGCRPRSLAASPGSSTTCSTWAASCAFPACR